MKKSNDEIIIRISKFKASFLTLLSIGLFCISVWTLTKIMSMESGFGKSYLLTLISFLTLAFAVGIVSGSKKLISDKPGIIITDKGIKINIGPNKGQCVYWSEIIKIKIHNQIRGNAFLLIFVKNPSNILNQSKGINRFLLKMNNMSHKTPLSISSTWLESSLFEILEIIKEKIKRPETGIL